MTNPDSLPAPPTGGPTPPPIRKPRSWLLYGCGGLLALLLIIMATVGITIWWIQRPIKPVVLSEKEKAVVEAKLQHLGESPATNAHSSSLKQDSQKVELDRPYVPGSRELQLTERELNGLLNANTELGQTVRLELGKNAINAYLAVPIPEDFPIGGGKMFRARGRFQLSLTEGAPPVAMLEDVTIFGLSLPEEWLGGLKGENLIADAVGMTNGATVLSGVKSLRIVPGAILLEVND